MNAAAAFQVRIHGQPVGMLAIGLFERPPAGDALLEFPGQAAKWHVGAPPTVQDTEAGFDPADAPRLFGAFQRLHDQRDFAGTGIGLATVKRVVTFRFSLPRPH